MNQVPFNACKNESVLLKYLGFFQIFDDSTYIYIYICTYVYIYMYKYAYAYTYT